MIGYTRAEPPLWKLWVPVRVRAMVKTDSVLFAAGPPDVLDSEDPFAAFECRQGGRLVMVDPKDGTKIAERELPSPPVFDGMIAADGRLYITTCDGNILCLKEQ